jgi:type IV pilus modification protein PilV
MIIAYVFLQPEKSRKNQEAAARKKLIIHTMFEQKRNIMKKKVTPVNKRGFSLVEVILSLFIITVGLVAMITMMANSIRDTQSSRDQIIATQLAQEGVELVKNIKENTVAPATFTVGTDRCVDMNDLTDTHSGTATYCHGRVLYRNAAGLFSHSTAGGATPSKFLRRIDIAGDVISTVSWDGSSVPAGSAGCTLADKCVRVRLLLP